MKKVLIVEDNEIHGKTLIRLIKEIDYEIQLFYADNIEDAYRLSMENTINLFLVDIILNTETRGDISGLTFAQRIRGVSKYSFTPLIFITSLEDPKLHAYREIHCFGYIEKPFNPLEVKSLIIKAFEFPVFQDKEKNIFFRKDGVVYSVKCKDIVYIENIRRSIEVHTTKETLTIPYKTCEKILEELDSDEFIQCSRYAIINKNFVKYVDYTNRFVRLHGVEDDIEIGISMKKRFKHELGD